MKTEKSLLTIYCSGINSANNIFMKHPLNCGVWEKKSEKKMEKTNKTQFKIWQGIFLQVCLYLRVLFFSAVSQKHIKNFRKERKKKCSALY